MLATLLLAATVALTFDDIPGVSLPVVSCHEKLQWNRKLLATLQERKAPALGLVVGSRGGCDVTPFVNLWLDAGHDIGNHTWSHRDLNQQTAEAYIADIERGAVPLRGPLAKHGRKLRYFRHPMLHAGNTPEKKAAVDTYLREQGYVVAVVTFDNQEWVFAERYLEALAAKKDTKTIKTAYLAHMEATVAFFEKRTREVLGRDIPHVLLLHMNAINADTLDDVLNILERRGYRFVTMDEALRDPAYAQPDTYVGRDGLSWIHRWGLAKGMPVVMEPRD
jgi:peptidoglycan-N-acetylglucosamine deacetylase